VWKDTHRLAGWTFVIGGTVAVLSAFLLPAALRVPVSFAALMVGGLAPVIGSYVLWRRHGPDPTGI
jgi:uncharacterized membrane protein